MRQCFMRDAEVGVMIGEAQRTVGQGEPNIASRSRDSSHHSGSSRHSGAG
jgi:hypothetical protein